MKWLEAMGSWSTILTVKYLCEIAAQRCSIKLILSCGEQEVYCDIGVLDAGSGPL